MSEQPTTTAAATPSFKIVTGADSFGCDLKDALISHLKSLNIEVEDLGVSSYYSVAAEVGRRVSVDPQSTRGLVACGTGVGVSIFANKFPGVFAATCLTTDEAKNTRSINNCNVLAVSGFSTKPEAAVEILDAWLSTPFMSPCPASGSKPWPPEIESFLDSSIAEMSKIGAEEVKVKEEFDNGNTENCAVFCPAKSREFKDIDMLPGGSMKIVREKPTSAIVRFKAGSVEPAHHHTFGYDLVVLKGSKRVWNLSKDEKYDLGVGDYLFTPAGDVHRAKYVEDTEFFIKWDGHWDLLFDEELEVAKVAIAKESESGST